jgi:uncharacterized protein (TIGR00730 family)
MHPEPLKAYQDLEFLNRPHLRSVRLQLEYLKPQIIQHEEDILSTTVVFGSARTPEPDVAAAAHQAARQAADAAPGNVQLAAALKRAEMDVAHSNYYALAREFSARISEYGQATGMLELVVVTGGGPGIMEAANRGAHDVGAKSIGLNITLPHEQHSNPYITPELNFLFHYFSIRKMHFLLRARALCAFPGGFGTLDELFEALTLIQTHKTAPVPIVMFGKEYWDDLINWETFVNWGTISPRDLDLFQYVETVDEALEIVISHYEENREQYLTDDN